ncbi:MAG: sulfotransferase family 2 domain-containing protein [Pseudomonadota bacterium]
MPVLLKQHKLFYADVPKVACSSIKRMFFEIENGFEFQAFKANAKHWHIHTFYPGCLRGDFPEAVIQEYRRLAVVRDPIERFLSAYGNRVVHYGEASDQAVKKLGFFSRLKADPDLGEFIDSLEKYIEIPSLNWHCKPMVEFLGSDPSYFHAIYDIRQMDDFVSDVSKTVGSEVKAGRHQAGGPKFSRNDLNTKQVAKLEAFYSEDYKAFSRYF